MGLNTKHRTWPERTNPFDFWKGATGTAESLRNTENTWWTHFWHRTTTPTYGTSAQVTLLFWHTSNKILEPLRNTAPTTGASTLIWDLFGHTSNKILEPLRNTDNKRTTLLEFRPPTTKILESLRTTTQTTGTTALESLRKTTPYHDFYFWTRAT